MTIEDDIKKRLCPNCNVALLYEHEDSKLAGIGWKKCEFCSFCMLIESDSYENRSKNQKKIVDGK